MIDHAKLQTLGQVLLCALLVLAPAQAADRHVSLAGQFLVAEETMGDPRFAQSVIYMVQHDRQGALGLVINRPLGELPLEALSHGLSGEAEGLTGSALVHAGGPVQPELGFVIHSTDKLFEESLEVGDQIAVTNHSAILGAIGRGEAPERSLIVLGYSGWGPGQLEAELARNDWFTIAFDEELLFDSDHGSKWERAQAMRAIEL